MGEPNIKRILRELQFLKDLGLDDLRASIIDYGDVYNWKATIKGFEDSPYENNNYEILIVFPSRYPFKQPKVKFVTKIDHPDVMEDGSICLHFANWSPGASVAEVDVLRQPEKE